MVIIAAGPLTLRKGRSDSRSITTPSTPEHSMVTASATSMTPISGRPVRTTAWPLMPIICKVHMADEAADHEDVEVGEVDQFQDAVDQGEPKGEQRVHRAQAQPVDGLLQQQIRSETDIVPRASGLTAPLRCSGTCCMSSGVTSLSCLIWNTLIGLVLEVAVGVERDRALQRLHLDRWIASRMASRVGCLPPVGDLLERGDDHRPAS